LDPFKESHMLNRILIPLCVCLIAAVACNAPGSAEDCIHPVGRYVNTTVLDKCPVSMPSDIPHFCFELNFRGKDSVDIDNGFEKFSLPYTTEGEGCTKYKINGATLFGDMFFTIGADSTLQLIDTAWTKVQSYTSFKRMKGADGTDMRFEYLLNECMVTGEYSLFIEGNLSSHVATLLANGQMNGMKPYLGYSLCYAGDCLEITESPSRIIELIDDSGTKDLFAFKNVEGKMALEFYKIGDPIPDEKGGRSIGPMMYELRTE
jgi:hypothetical protein